MSLIEELKELGANTDEALNRFMNNQALYERMLRKLPASVKELNVMKALEEGDTETAFTAAHTIKGVTGNLSLTPLYRAYSDIVAYLRGGEPESAKAVLERILPLQRKMIQCIEKNRPQ